MIRFVVTPSEFLETIGISLGLFECHVTIQPNFDFLDGSLCIVSFYFGVLRIIMFLSVNTLLKAFDRNSSPLSVRSFVGCLPSRNMSSNAQAVVDPFLFFKGRIHTYLEKISMTKSTN